MPEPVELTIDTAPFDRAVAGIVANWRPPVDVKKVIVSELGAILALTSNDTLCAGPKGAKIKSISKSQTYLRKRYTWKAQSGRGRRAKQSADSIPVLQIKGKKYYRRHRYPAYIWTALLWELEKLKKKSTQRAGSSKAAWLWMYHQAQKAAGIRAGLPKSWKNPAAVSKAMGYMLSQAPKWKKATTAKKKMGRAGDFVLEVFSKAHNTLNVGVKGAAEFQAKLNGRAPFLAKALGKKSKTTMKNLARKYPGIEVLG